MSRRRRRLGMFAANGSQLLFLLVWSRTTELPNTIRVIINRNRLAKTEIKYINCGLKKKKLENLKYS